MNKFQALLRDQLQHEIGRYFDHFQRFISQIKEKNKDPRTAKRKQRNAKENNGIQRETTEKHRKTRESKRKAKEKDKNK